MFFLYSAIVPAFCISFEYFPNTKTSPTARILAAMEYSSNQSQIIVFGGKDSEGYSLELSIFHLPEEEWEIPKTGEVYPNGRHSMASMISGNGKFFYIIGGFMENGPTNEIWKLSLDDFSVIQT